MIPTNYVANQSVFFRILSDDQIEIIKRAAFEVIEKVGAQVLHEGARQLFKQAGATVKDDRVYVPQHIVEACIRTAPKGFTIYDRGGLRALEVRNP